MPKNNQKQYSAAEKRAYYMGVGAGIGSLRASSSLMKSMPAAVKESFKNGLDRGIMTKKGKMHWKSFHK